MHNSKYQDMYGLWHDKAPNGGEPTSNNWMIYTAYASLLNLPIGDVDGYFKRCTESLTRDNITVNRHPGKRRPPLSADEAIGAFLLYLLPYDVLKGNHFVFHGHGKPVNARTFEDLVKGILKLSLHLKLNLFMPEKRKVTERNIFWERKIKELYQVAYRLHPAYVRAIKHIARVSAHREERELFNFYRDNLIKSRKTDKSTLSQKNLLWALLYAMDDEKRAKKLQPWKNFEGYFGKDHDLTKAMKKLYGR